MKGGPEDRGSRAPNTMQDCLNRSSRGGHLLLFLAGNKAKEKRVIGGEVEI